MNDARCRRIGFVLGVLALAGPLLAQSAATAPKNPFAAASLRETLSWLADDARMGRDTPSPGLDAAAEYLAGRFEAAGLEPAGDDGTWFDRFTLPGLRLTSDGLEVTAHAEGGDVVLRPGEDVRPLQISGAYEGMRLPGPEAASERSSLRRRLRGGAAVLVAVAEDSLLWRQAALDRDVLRSSFRGPPVLLVRDGVLPAGELTVSVKVPAPKPVDVTLRNVVARLPGGDRADEAVMVSAHYDHIGVGRARDGDEIYNGADDDGTGTTAVVALAEALARRDRPLPRSVLFVCFTGEEKGLLGSKAFAGDPPVPLESISAVVNLEMLGRPWKPHTAWITGRRLSDFEAIAAPALARAGIDCGTFPQEGMLFSASDNLPLARKGIVAHTISASSLHEDYHGLDDEVDKIDFDNLAAVLHGVEQVVIDFASREQPPAYDDDGIRTLGLDR